MKYWLPLFVFGWMILCSEPLTALACRGPFLKSTKEVFDRSTAVFYGRVLNLVEIGPYPTLPSSKIYEARFQVYRWWKGESKKEVSVRFDTTTCGARFDKDQNYVVFASGSPLGSSAMSMNRLILKPNEELKSILQEFGSGKIPL